MLAANSISQAWFEQETFGTSDDSGALVLLTPLANILQSLLEPTESLCEQEKIECSTPHHVFLTTPTFAARITLPFNLNPLLCV